MSIQSSSSSAEEQTARQIGLLNAVDDLYGGVTVEMKEPMDPKDFVPLLRASMSQWRRQGKKGVWIKLSIQLCNLVEPTVKEGFRYHHAEPDYLMLVYWIPKTPETIPANASHTVGIGAFVLNSKSEVLVVQEKSGSFKDTDVWKIPTGVVNEGEDFFMAAIREVKEETGINTKFMEVLTFSQWHGSLFGKSDLFFVCMLQPLSFDIQKQDSEIKAAKWMPIEEYAAQSYHKNHTSFEYVAKICLCKSRGAYVGFSGIPTGTSTDPKGTSSTDNPYMYFNRQDFDPLLSSDFTHNVRTLL